MELSKDRKYLMIEQEREVVISEIALILKDEMDKTIVADVSVPSSTGAFVQRIRIDSFLPLIFQSGDILKYLELEDLHDLVNFKDKPHNFSLIITVHLGGEIRPPEISIIYSEQILVKSLLVLVSRELLAIYSDYFTSFFYGNYQEKENEIKAINEVCEDHFVRFMTLLHKRKLEMSSVKLGLIALGFADYFRMKGVVAKTLPFLLGNDLPVDLLNDALELSDKLPNNAEMIDWVLKKIPNHEKFFQVLHDSLPIISPQTAQYCLTKLQEKANHSFKPQERANNSCKPQEKANLSPKYQYETRSRHSEGTFRYEASLRASLTTNQIDFTDDAASSTYGRERKKNACSIQ